MSNAATDVELQHTFTELGDGSRPFFDSPGFCEEAGLWFYGNMNLLRQPLAYVEESLLPPPHDADLLCRIEKRAEEIVLSSSILVCALNNWAHRRAMVVPLRWGAPRIVVMSGGFRFHLGHELLHEPFRAARLWRYKWDSQTDLAVSRRAPDKLATFASHNPSINRLVVQLVGGEIACLPSVVAQARLSR